jgi:hypothetical protein
MTSDVAGDLNLGDVIAWVDDETPQHSWVVVRKTDKDVGFLNLTCDESDADHECPHGYVLVWTVTYDYPLHDVLNIVRAS